MLTNGICSLMQLGASEFAARVGGRGSLDLLGEPNWIRNDWCYALGRGTGIEIDIDVLHVAFDARGREKEPLD